MKPAKLISLLIALALALTGCTDRPAPTQPATTPTLTTEPTAEPTTEPVTEPAVPGASGGVEIVLGDEAILVDGQAIGTDEAAPVYMANDIVYYEEGKDFTYGEGTAADAHSADEAGANTVVHITRPGTYILSGTLSKGQVAVDLGGDAEDDPNAVVTLILSGVDITCEVAPAVIFYNVYECGSDDTATATKDVDTSAAGANVIIADGTVNNIKGSYVARIYKPGTLELSADGTEVLDAKKLHKYDAAFYSKKTMNVTGGDLGTGVLNIHAENEGLDSELHLTVNGGNINIFSGNDGINTNEDGVSVTTVNGGTLKILVTGETGEGDGIDSNGWLVINGGTVIAGACSFSGDAGIDSDMGIHINGGTVIATGSMLDRIEDGGQTYAVFTFAGRQTGAEMVALKNAVGRTVLEHTPVNAYSILVFSSPDLEPGDYTLYSDDRQLSGQVGGGMGGFPGGMGGEGQMPPDGEMPPQGGRPQMPPEGEMPPQGGEPQMPPEGEMPPQGGEPQMPPEGEMPPQGGRPQNPQGGNAGALSPEFRILAGGNYFSHISVPAS